MNIDQAIETKVIIIEDNPNDIVEIGKVAKMAGVTIQSFRKIPEILELLQSKEELLGADLILVDNGILAYEKETYKTFTSEHMSEHDKPIIEILNKKGKVIGFKIGFDNIYEKKLFYKKSKIINEIVALVGSEKVISITKSPEVGNALERELGIRYISKEDLSKLLQAFTDISSKSLNLD